MAKNKKSFVAYCDWLEAFEELTNEEAGKLVKHLFRYVNDQSPEAPDRLTKMCFIPIKQSLKRDLIKFETIKEKRVQAGRKGGKANQANARNATPTQANQAVSVNGSVNGSVNVNETNKGGRWFSNDKLNDSFTRWLKMCQEKGKARPTTSIEAIVMKMNYKTTEQNIVEVEQALENGWLNIYEVKPKTYRKDEKKITYDPPPNVLSAISGLHKKMTNEKK